MHLRLNRPMFITRNENQDIAGREWIFEHRDAQSKSSADNSCVVVIPGIIPQKEVQMDSGIGPSVSKCSSTLLSNMKFLVGKKTKNNRNIYSNKGIRHLNWFQVALLKDRTFLIIK